MLHTKCIFEALFVMMRKLLLLIVGFILAGNSFAQTKRCYHSWVVEDAPKSTLVGSTNSENSSRQERVLSNLNLQLEPNVLLYQHQWEDTGFANENSLQITNIVYADLTAEEMGKVNTNLVPTPLKYSISSTKAVTLFIPQ